MLTEHSKDPSEQKKRDFFPAKNPVDARREVVYCVSFWFWRGISFGFTYSYVLRVQYSCGVVLVFWFWREIVFLCNVST